MFQKRSNILHCGTNISLASLLSLCFLQGGQNGNRRGLHRLFPPQLCRDEQTLGKDAASGSHTRPRETGEREEGAEDISGD